MSGLDGQARILNLVHVEAVHIILLQALQTARQALFQIVVIVRFGDEPQFLTRFAMPGRALRLQKLAETPLGLPAVVTFRRVYVVDALLDPHGHHFAVHAPRAAHRQPRHLDARASQHGIRHFRRFRVRLRVRFIRLTRLVLRLRLLRRAPYRQARRAQRRAAPQQFPPRERCVVGFVYEGRRQSSPRRRDAWRKEFRKGNHGAT